METVLILHDIAFKAKKEKASQLLWGKECSELSVTTLISLFQDNTFAHYHILTKCHTFLYLHA